MRVNPRPVYWDETGERLVRLANNNEYDTVPTGGGGSGIQLESYQNSAMSAPVMAYVFKDESDAIYQVYEPIQNNTVSRSQFAYADSIDLFPFDSADVYKNRVNDVKLIDVGSDLILQASNLENMVIDGNSFTSLKIINTIYKGKYGLALPNSAEIYIQGNNVQISVMAFIEPGGDSFGNIPCIDSPGDNSRIIGSILIGSTVNGNSHTITLIGSYLFYAIVTYNSASDIEETEIYESLITADNSNLYDNVFRQCYHNISFTNCADVENCVFEAMGNAPGGESSFSDISGTMYFNKFSAGSTAVITGCTDFSKNKIGVAAKITNNGHEINECTIGDNATVSASDDKTNIIYNNIGGTTYELGVTAGAVTATEV